MKQFPRIYSLCTLGLIHHQEYEYKFHPFRTDFIGESGAGKSMIADLLQLIFVGSDAFESATKSTGERKPSGMVLEAKAHNTIGYAFLNIEKGPNQFLCIGNYIEASSRNTQSFIIQSGYDYPVTYLSSPLNIEHFMENQEILPIDLLKEKMHGLDLFCESWIRPKKYHQILFDENILPLDLASNERLLKDYATILQSFSRGKSVDIQKSSSLKQFLFGNEKAKEIHEKYKLAMQDMESNIGEYGHNLKEIELVTQKQKHLLDLKLKKEKLDQAEHIWILQNYLYCNQQKTQLALKLKLKIEQYQLLNNNIPSVYDSINKEQELITALISEMTLKAKFFQDDFDIISPRFKKLNNISNLLTTLAINIEALKKTFLDNVKYKKLNNDFHKLNNVLISREVPIDAIPLDFQGNYSNFIEFLQSKIRNIEGSLKEKKRLKSFGDLTNTTSLAFWAVSQKRAFTPEEESLLYKFQGLTTQNENELNDYIFNASELMTTATNAEKEGNGFWINLKGIKKHVEYASEFILAVYDSEKISRYFENYTDTLNLDIENLKTELALNQKINSIFTDLFNASDLYNALRNQKFINSFHPNPELNITEEEFEIQLNCYLEKESIGEIYRSTKSNLDQLTEKRDLIIISENNFKNLKESLQNIKNKVIILNINNMEGEFAEYFSPTIKNLDIPNNLEGDEKITWYKKVISDFQNAQHNSTDLLELADSFKLSIEQEKHAEEIFRKYDPDSPLPKPEPLAKDPIQEKMNFEKFGDQYVESFNSLLQTYIPTEAYKFQDNPDFIEFSKSLLPEALGTSLMEDSEENIIDIIAAYLKQINEKNRQLNNRKILRIKDLIDEVENVITEHMDKARRIDNFLNSGKLISGGYQVRLIREQSPYYSKDWMQIFRDKIEQEVGLFAPVDGLSVALSKKVSLDEIITEAFRLCQGSKSIDASPLKLLDPANYYDLTFQMQSENGRINLGSTGQTYASIALLCIARLSIMTGKEGKKIDPSLRVMPIDEAEGLGSNYDMLYQIAKEYDYQIISLSVNPVGNFKQDDQYIYMLHKNMEEELPVNYTPMAIFCDEDLKNF